MYYLYEYKVTQRVSPHTRKKKDKVLLWRHGQVILFTGMTTIAGENNLPSLYLQVNQAKFLLSIALLNLKYEIRRITKEVIEFYIQDIRASHSSILPSTPHGKNDHRV